MVAARERRQNCRLLLSSVLQRLLVCSVQGLKNYYFVSSTLLFILVSFTPSFPDVGLLLFSLMNDTARYLFVLVRNMEIIFGYFSLFNVSN